MAQVRLEAHDGGVSGGHLHNVHPVDDWSDPASIYGGHRLREALPAEEAHPDPALLAQRRHLPEGRTALPHVPRRRHAQEPHHRGPRPGPDDQEKS